MSNIVRLYNYKNRSNLIKVLIVNSYTSVSFLRSKVRLAYEIETNNSGIIKIVKLSLPGHIYNFIMVYLKVNVIVISICLKTKLVRLRYGGLRA